MITNKLRGAFLNTLPCRPRYDGIFNKHGRGPPPFFFPVCAPAWRERPCKSESSVKGSRASSRSFSCLEIIYLRHNLQTIRGQNSTALLLGHARPGPDRVGWFDDGYVEAYPVSWSQRRTDCAPRLRRPVSNCPEKKPSNRSAICVVHHHSDGCSSTWLRCSTTACGISPRRSPGATNPRMHRSSVYLQRSYLAGPTTFLRKARARPLVSRQSPSPKSGTFETVMGWRESCCCCCCCCCCCLLYRVPAVG